jgi:hypothetical protein
MRYVYVLEWELRERDRERRSRRGDEKEKK